MVPGLSTITVNREPLHSRAAHGATGSQTRFSEHITGKDRPQWHSSKRARLVPMVPTHQQLAQPDRAEARESKLQHQGIHGQGTDLRGTRPEQGPASSPMSLQQLYEYWLKATSANVQRVHRLQKVLIKPPNTNKKLPKARQHRRFRKAQVPGRSRCSTRISDLQRPGTTGSKQEESKGERASIHLPRRMERCPDAVLKLGGGGNLGGWVVDRAGCGLWDLGLWAASAIGGVFGSGLRVRRHKP